MDKLVINIGTHIKHKNTYRDNNNGVIKSYMNILLYFPTVKYLNYNVRLSINL